MSWRLIEFDPVAAFTLSNSLVLDYVIRHYVRDINLGMCPVQNGVSYLNVLAHFGESSQTAVAKNN